MIPGPIRRSVAPLLAAALLLLPACSPPEHAPVPPACRHRRRPTPPRPNSRAFADTHLRPLQAPRYRRLFNGIQLQTSFSTEPGGAATAEARLAVQLHAPSRSPRPHAPGGHLAGGNDGSQSRAPNPLPDAWDHGSSPPKSPHSTSAFTGIKSSPSSKTCPPGPAPLPPRFLRLRDDARTPAARLRAQGSLDPVGHGCR